MMVADDNLLVYLNIAVVNLSDTDAPYIFIVVNRADKNLCTSVRVSLGSGNIVKDCLKQRRHVNACRVLFQGSDACFGGCVYKRAVKLGIVGVKLQEQLQNLVDNLAGTRLGTVNLVDAHDDGKLELQCLLQYEFCLWHCALKRIDNKDDTIYHFQDTLYLAAKVGMSRRVNNIYLGAFIHNGCIF